MTKTSLTHGKSEVTAHFNLKVERLERIIKGNPLPEFFDELLEECKKCYAYGLHFSLISICKAIVEISVKDIVKRKRLDRNNFNDEKRFDSISFLMGCACRGEIREDLREVYYSQIGSALSGNEVPLERETEAVFKGTLRVMKKIYDYHGIGS